MGSTFSSSERQAPSREVIFLPPEFQGGEGPNPTHQSQGLPKTNPVSVTFKQAQPPVTGAEALHFCEFTNNPRDACNSQWLMLWSTAAYASEHPTDTERKDLEIFYRYFPDRCRGVALGDMCYSDFVARNPPRTSSRRELLAWMCLAENHCRAKVGLPHRSCGYRELMKRWRYPDDT